MLPPSPRWRVVLAVLLLPATALAAADVEVGYLIARPPPGGEAADDTRVAFTLHADAECSSPAIRTVVTRLKDVARQDVLRDAPASPGWKRPNALRLVATFRDVEPSASPFVRVTGPGILPAGVACQMWHRAGQGTLHSTAAELRERMIPPGAARARPYGATALPGAGAADPPPAGAPSR